MDPATAFLLAPEPSLKLHHFLNSKESFRQFGRECLLASQLKFGTSPQWQDEGPGPALWAFGLERRLIMILTGTMALQAGDNLRILQQKLLAYFPD